MNCVIMFLKNKYRDYTSIKNYINTDITLNYFENIFKNF